MLDATMVMGAALAAVLAVLAVTGLILLAPRRVRASSRAPEAGVALPAPRSFRFRQGFLVSSSEGASLFLPEPVNQLTAWNDLRTALSGMVPGIAVALERLATSGQGFRLGGHLGGDLMQVIGLRDGEETRITVLAATGTTGEVRIDLATLDALEAETNLLNQSQNASPALSWVVDRDGRVIWGNARYLTEVAGALGAEAAAGWPLPALFPEAQEPPVGPTRRSLGGGRGKPERWFEVTHTQARGGLRHAHAQPLNRLIEAESNLRTFIQTLTRTFAALPTGLAIFDQGRRLVMYNPQLLDMTGLDGAWLTTKPSLVDVLDALRERQRLPEPRDWKGWRDRVVAVGEGEASQTWQENWTLPGGQSLRMTVRPQGGGAVAILLEDVTAEFALARRRRSDGALLSAMLDTTSDAYAAFAADGGALHMNARMRRLLDIGPGAEATLDALLARLATLFPPTPLWAEARDMIRDGIFRLGWAGRLALEDGGAVELRVIALVEGRVALRLSGDLDDAVTRQRTVEPPRDRAAGM